MGRKVEHSRKRHNVYEQTGLSDWKSMLKGMKVKDCWSIKYEKEGDCG